MTHYPKDPTEIALLMEDDVATTKVSLAYLQKLKDLAYKDQLTGLGSRTTDVRAVASMLKRADRTNKPIALISFDISNFKALNDTHGHNAGDKALQIIGNTMAKLVRNGGDRDPEERDVVGIATRPGGDEFNIILYNADEDKANLVINRIEKAVNERLEDAGLGIIKTRQGSRRVLAVGGAAIRQPGDTTPVSKFRDAADKAVIRRKADIKKRLGEPEGRVDPDDIIRR